MKNRRAKMMSNLRLAGQVRRYHTWPTVQKQTVAEHTWHVIRIWLQLWKFIPAPVLPAVVYHDCPELYTGDHPYPVKKDNPDLKAAVTAAEAHGATLLGILDVAAELTEQERIRLKLCDLLEMWEFGLHECRLGNAFFAAPIVDDTAEDIGRILLMYPDERAAVRGYMETVREGLS